jgi:cytochrome oxidase Cu insertion factor (SCO1/SenC/PrrC family)
MSYPMRSMVLMTAVVLLAATTGYSQGKGKPASQEHTGLKVGQLHPDFTLPAINDRAPISLSSFRGKKVLLIQFASW